MPVILDGKRVDRVLRAKIEARRRGKHHQHHRRENADGGEARAVSLHAVGERREGNKVALFVVEFFILLECFAERHAAGDEEKIRR